MADIAELIVALKLQDGVSSGLGRLDGRLKGLQGGLAQVGKGIGQVGRGLDTALTRGALVAGGALGFVVKSAVEFEDAFTGVAKTVDASKGQLAVLSDEIRAMSREMPIAATELANIAEQAGALGVAVADIDEFTRVAALIGVTTDVSSDQAATALGQLSNVLNLSGADYERFASTLVDLGNKGASTESQILEIATRAGAAGALIGLSADQVLAFGSAAANLGIEAEAGGSALQRFFIDTLTNIQDGDLLGVMAKTAGTTGAAFKQAFEKDAAGALSTFVQGLGKLDDAAQIETLQTLGFNDVRITRLLLGFANDTDNLTASLNTAETAFRANVALQTEAERKFANTASQLQILKNNVTDAAVTIGNELLPVIASLSQDFVGFLNQPGVQAGIKEFATDLAGGIRGLATELKGTDFGPLLETLKGAAAITKGAFEAFNALPGPVKQLALAAIVANKVTGGALFQIAGGLANIFGGALKTIHAAHVTVIGAGGSLPTGPLGPTKGPGNLLGNAWKLLPPLAAAALASEFSDEITGFGVGLRTDLAKSLGVNLPTFKAADFDWPFGTRNTPTILPGFLDFGPNGIFGGTPSYTPATKTTGSRSRGGMDLAAQDRTYQAEDRRVMTSLVAELALSRQSTAMAAIAAASSDAAMLATAQFQTSKLDIANAQLGVIATRKPVINVTNNINLSPTVIQQRISQIRTLSGSGGFI